MKSLTIHLHPKSLKAASLLDCTRVEMKGGDEIPQWVPKQGDPNLCRTRVLERTKRGGAKMDGSDTKMGIAHTETGGTKAGQGQNDEQEPKQGFVDYLLKAAIGAALLTLLEFLRGNPPFHH